MIDLQTSERLERAQIVWFTSVRPDRSPHPVPVWFVHDDDSLWAASGPSARKVANVRHNDQVSIAVDGSAPQTLVAQTRAEIVDEITQYPDVIASFASKYHGFDITDDANDGPLVLMRLTITRWLLDGSTQ